MKRDNQQVDGAAEQFRSFARHIHDAEKRIAPCNQPPPLGYFTFDKVRAMAGRIFLEAMRLGILNDPEHTLLRLDLEDVQKHELAGGPDAVPQTVCVKAAEYLIARSSGGQSSGASQLFTLCGLKGHFDEVTRLACVAIAEFLDEAAAKTQGNKPAVGEGKASPCQIRALQQYQDAIATDPRLQRKDCQTVYKSVEARVKSFGNPNDLPDFNTWTRYVRAARKKL
ncbi:MAG: hypothetical protein NTU53_23005 [Planctomycetota bacterium]|nr:hypothetical protein [Planctomycetota bacterium]